jgi:hypothetical protein
MRVSEPASATGWARIWRRFANVRPLRSGGQSAAFYESHPYPAPLSNLDRHRELYRNPDRRRAASHLLWPTRKPRPDRKILIAGRGTSQAVIHAMREPDAQVVGNTKAPKPLMTLPEPRRSAPARAICLRLLELLEARASPMPLTNQETRDSPQAAQTEGQAGSSRPVRSPPLSIHVERSARNPPCHHAAVQTLDYSQGLANQGTEAAKISRAGGL